MQPFNGGVGPTPPPHGMYATKDTKGNNWIRLNNLIPISTIVYCFQWKMKEASQTSTLTKESTEIELRELNLQF